MKYAPLQRFLEGMTPSKNDVTLSFGEIEKIIDAKLPNSAFMYREWWANQEGGSRAPYWQAAGFVIDTVDLQRKLAYFRRGSAVKRGSASKQNVAKKAASREPFSEDILLKAGFKKFGHWELRDGAIELTGNTPATPGTYGHVVNGMVYYIGAATIGLRKRMYSYGKPGKSQKTSIRINGLIKDELEASNIVELIAVFPEPTTWSGLPVNLVTGLEAGLIKEFAPPWNKRGVQGKA